MVKKDFDIFHSVKKKRRAHPDGYREPNTIGKVAGT
jgi:hypothetical protein